MATQEYKCPNCGGAVSWSPGTQELTCPYCDSVINIEAFEYVDGSGQQTPGQQAEIWDYTGNEWQQDEQQGLVVYTCQSCSGEIVGEKTLGAATCPFCGSSVVVTATFSGALRPDLVIPFKLDRQYAISSLENHYANKKLLPEVFKERNHLEEVKGIYVPFWLYNADADAHIEYRGQKIRTWSDSRYIYTETSHYQIIREGTIGFDAVPADGSEKADDTLMESLEPYNTAEAVDFNNAYLAGFYANKYDYDAKHCSPRVNERITNSTVDEFAKTVMGYTGVRPVSKNVRIDCNGVRYAMLPVWMLGSTWEDKRFVFAMNGQTGKFVGDLPLDKKKKWRLFGMMAGIIAASLLLLMALLLTFGYIVPFEDVHIGYMVIGGLFTFTVPLIVVSVWTSQLKSVRPRDCASDYIRRGSFSLRVQRDIFLYRNITRVPRAQNSGGGGRGGFGSSTGRRGKF